MSAPRVTPRASGTGRREQTASSREVTLVLPLPPNLANSRMHWRVKEKHRKEYDFACTIASARRSFPDLPATPWPSATVRAVLTMYAAMDDDNAMARCKWALDWCVRRGYLLDDKRKVLRWEGLPEQVITRKGPHSLTLVFTPSQETER